MRFGADWFCLFFPSHPHHPYNPPSTTLAVPWCSFGSRWTIIIKISSWGEPQTISLRCFDYFSRRTFGFIFWAFFLLLFASLWLQSGAEKGLLNKLLDFFCGLLEQNQSDLAEALDCRADISKVIAVLSLEQRPEIFCYSRGVWFFSSH